jgi:hypothetical protein
MIARQFQMVGKDGQVYDVEVVVDVNAIARRLGTRAIASKGKAARSLQGAVVVKAKKASAA